MGITVVQRSDLRIKKPKAKVALVLAGGAVAGGAYKIGGLKALNDYLVNRKVTDFDIYIGLSAGAFLAAPLAAGIGPEEMLRSIDGKSERFSQLRFGDFYNPNFSEFAYKPLKAAFDLLSFVPRVGMTSLRTVRRRLRPLVYAALRYLAVQDGDAMEELLHEMAVELGDELSFPSPISYLPSGLFDNRTIERFIRQNLEANGMTNDFRELRQQTGRSLYIPALNLDTGDRVVFGPDADCSVSVSEAIQASTALPGFYRPARLRGKDFIDGGVINTANVSVALEHGADLIICYNPFRPIYNHIETVRDMHTGRSVRKGRPLADDGIAMVLNQVFRSLLHSRLQYTMKRYAQDPDFHGDIILIEPTDYDYEFFFINPLAFWERARAAQHGFESVKKSIERQYGLMRQILSSYGIEMTRKYVADDMSFFAAHRGDAQAILSVLQTEKPRVDIRVVGGDGI